MIISLIHLSSFLGFFILTLFGSPKIQTYFDGENVEWCTQQKHIFCKKVQPEYTLLNKETTVLLYSTKCFIITWAWSYLESITI